MILFYKHAMLADLGGAKKGIFYRYILKKRYTATKSSSYIMQPHLGVENIIQTFPPNATVSIRAFLSEIIPATSTFGLLKQQTS